jgi:membrane-associated phospholipid phosphatase
MDQIKNSTKPFVSKDKLTLLILTFLLFWIPVITFSKLAGEIVENEPMAADTSILQWIHSHATPALDVFFLVVTTIGDVEILLPATLIIAGYLLYKKQRLNALIILFSVGGAATANFMLKLLFHRDRPSFWHSLITETGYSFPSGHAMLSSALILSIIFIAWKTRWRWLTVTLGMIIIALIGLSRLYMGVHYPTDIIAGWSVSLVWVFVEFAVLSGLSYRLYRKK